jgi:hypothetical protein
LGTWAIVLAFIFGLVVPMLANILPTQAALGKNLRNSLDLNHRAQDGVSVKQQRLDDMVGLSVT